MHKLHVKCTQLEVKSKKHEVKNVIHLHVAKLNHHAVSNPAHAKYHDLVCFILASNGDFQVYNNKHMHHRIEL